MSHTAFATQQPKPKSRKVTPLGKLLATYNELLGAWITSGLVGSLEVRNNNLRDYQIAFCGHEPVGFSSIAIYENDRDFELKKQRILDYLSGKIDYLEGKDECLL
jgi:hypothetical protein